MKLSPHTYKNIHYTWFSNYFESFCTIYSVEWQTKFIVVSLSIMIIVLSIFNELFVAEPLRSKHIRVVFHVSSVALVYRMFVKLLLANSDETFYRYTFFIYYIYLNITSMHFVIIDIIFYGLILILHSSLFNARVFMCKNPWKSTAISTIFNQLIGYEFLPFSLGPLVLPSIKLVLKVSCRTKYPINFPLSDLIIGSNILFYSFLSMQLIQSHLLQVQISIASSYFLHLVLLGSKFNSHRTKYFIRNFW